MRVRIKPWGYRVLVSTAVLAVGLGGAAPAMAGKPSQTGLAHACTVVGTNANDHLFATHGYEVICGLGGDDVIVGSDGDDILIGGDGNDTIVGGGGNDQIAGDDGNDTITAGSGNDAVEGDDGNDTVNGNDGDDVLLGNEGNDTVNGDGGNDTIDGAAGDDTIDGGPGADTIEAGTGVNTCRTDASDTSACSDLKLPEVDGASVQWVGDPRVDNALDQVVKLRLRATDDRSGVAGVSATLTAPTGTATVALTAAKLVSGTANDGVWEITGTVPAFSPVGDWRITQVMARDRVGQYRFYNVTATGAYTTYDHLVSGTFRVGPLTVAGAPDFRLPEVDGSAVQWVGDPRVDNSVDRVVRLRLRATDDVSGVGYLSATVTAPTGTATASLSAPKLVSGTVRDGVWELSGTIPAFSPLGDWRVSQLGLRDRVNQYRFYNITASGTYTTYDHLVSGTLGVGPLTVVGAADLKLPEVDGASAQWVTDQRVDNSAARVVKLRVRATDDVSGVGSVFATLKSPTGTVSLWLDAHLVSGTANDGVWELSATVPALAPLGNWRVTQLGLRDRVNQYRFYNITATGAYTTYDGLVSGTIPIAPLLVFCPAA